VLLLRHASAGERLSSPAIDRFRQLDHAGKADARQLIWTLGAREIARVVSSPLPRCVETVIPIAESRRLIVEQRTELSPEAELESTLELLVLLPDETLVCTHREVILRLFEGGVTCEEGGAWALERVGPLLSPTEYIAPPRAVPDAFPRTVLSRAR